MENETSQFFGKRAERESMAELWEVTEVEAEVNEEQLPQSEIWQFWMKPEEGEWHNITFRRRSCKFMEKIQGRSYQEEAGVFLWCLHPELVGWPLVVAKSVCPPRDPLQCQWWSEVSLLHQLLGHGRVGHSSLVMQSCIITEMHGNSLIRKGIKNAAFSLVHCRFQLVICVGKRPQSWGWECHCLCRECWMLRAGKASPLSLLEERGDARAKKLNWILWLLSVGYGASYLLYLLEKQCEFSITGDFNFCIYHEVQWWWHSVGKLMEGQGFKCPALYNFQHACSRPNIGPPSGKYLGILQKNIVTKLSHFCL